jgi:hypothetical protein
MHRSYWSPIQPKNPDIASCFSWRPDKPNHGQGALAKWKLSEDGLNSTSPERAGNKPSFSIDPFDHKCFRLNLPCIPEAITATQNSGKYVVCAPKPKFRRNGKHDAYSSDQQKSFEAFA